MDNATLTLCYQLIAELFLYPERRDEGRIARLFDALSQAPGEVLAAFERFLSSDGSRDVDEYIQTLGLSPPCPPYLGTYLFEEPTTCRGVGMSGRNRYMLELKNVYKHFGFDMTGGELPDFIPVVVDFLWISLAHPERDEIGLRRHLLEEFLVPAMEPLHKKLTEFESTYALLVEALGWALEADLKQMGDTVAWRAPVAGFPQPQPLVRKEVAA